MYLVLLYPLVEVSFLFFNLEPGLVFASEFLNGIFVNNETSTSALSIS